VSPDKPPRPGRGVLWRALIAALLTIALSAGAVSAAVLLQIHNVTQAFVGTEQGRTSIRIPEVTQAQAGGPRTFLILGSDARYADRQNARSDTILLVRVNPDTKRIAVMSIPRDLKVRIPGFRSDKINAAYADGGPRKSVQTIKQLFGSATGGDFPINNVINVTFGGFRRAVDYVGGVYVDVDRRYFNDNAGAAPGQGYATIDVQPGYQRLKGQDALDYVRYRHGDSDLFRASRQQDFLRQVAGQDSVRKLLDFGKRNQLARIFGRCFEVDKSFLSAGNLLSLVHMGIYLAGSHAPVNEVRFPAIVSPNPANTYLSYKPADVRQAAEEFLSGAGSANPKATATKSDNAFKRSVAKRTKPSAISGLEQATNEGVNLAVVADPQLNFPFYYPALRVTGSRYTTTQARVYDVADEQGVKHQAYRLVLYTGDYGEYYGVQGLAWRYPPILDNPDATRKVGSKRLMLFYDGSHLRLVAWRTPKAVYWVTNTLDLAISNSKLVAIAGSLSRLKQ
jgi:LCP family protein required for cell wall assembly